MGELLKVNIQTNHQWPITNDPKFLFGCLLVTVLLGIGAIPHYEATPTIYFHEGKASEITPISSLSLTPTPEEVKSAVVFVEKNMGLKDFTETINNESSFDYKAFAPNKYGGSKNVGQFILSTFKANCVGDYDSPHDQIICMAIMFKIGKQDQWDAWCLKHGKDNMNCKLREL